jgi:hypothetical protein
MPRQPVEPRANGERRGAACPHCCGHGVALVWFCTWCAEVEEFGSSDFGVWGPEQVMACEHVGIATAS